MLNPQLISTVINILRPHLPTLIAAMGTVGNGTLTAVGEAVPQKVQQLWGKMIGALTRKPAAQEAATDLATAPDDPDLQAAFRVQLKKVLEADPVLAEEIASWLAEQPEEIAQTSIQQTTIGNQNQTIGQVSGSRNKVVGTESGASS
ncbi:hypothetical protein [Laspinema olomoucense]|uniref:hypothetical protein n=1 Tax=Laspinema olomoucense TaxID=3231600 RepID=UPI0021BADBFF|nr:MULTISPECIES: hypothetical protein [unclassified Laspinema]MCT7970743.1 hypothetical protein [Laspinema sp. D3d]MCT7993681.1 hypothetical protein [Laspinema sp. D3c]